MDEEGSQTLDPNSQIGKLWMDVLFYDDATTAERMLNTADSHLTEKLLHGVILEDPAHEAIYTDKRLHVPGFRIIRPFNTALAFGSFKVLRVLLDHDVDVYKKDLMGNNTIHCLTYLAYLNEEREDQFVKTYRILNEMLDVEVMRNLLFTENQVFLRPLELAVHLGAFEMYKTIFDTKGVYLVKQEVFRSFYHVNWYDVTDYEGSFSESRSHKSPLLFFIFIDHDRLSAATKSKFYMTSPMKDWISKKCDSYGPYIWFWVALRLSFIVLFFVLDFSEPITEVYTATNGSAENATTCISEVLHISSGGRMAITIYLLIYSLAVIILDCAEMSKIILTISKYIRRLPRRRKTYVAYYRLYRGLQFFLMITSLISTSTSIGEQATGLFVPAIVKHLLYLIQCVCMVWSMLYFLQLIPFLGYFVVTIQRMINELLRFILLFFLILVPFALTFRRIVRDEEECVEPFRTIPLSVYTTFTVMLNMVNFTNFTLNGSFVSSAIVHVVFVFLVAILLVNFLIALFSSSVAEITDNRDAIMAIQRLSVHWTLEYRVARLLKGTRIAGRRRKKIFVTKNGRVYITKVTVCCGERIGPLSIKAQRTESHFY